MLNYYVNYRLCKLIQSRSNGDTEEGALMFVFYFDTNFSNAGTDVFCVCLLGNVITFVTFCNNFEC